MQSPTIILIGLGPGDPALLTRAAWETLATAPKVYTPTPRHGALAELDPAKIAPLPAAAADAAAVLAAHAAAEPQICCAVAGHPHDHVLTQQLHTGTCNVTIIPGISLLDALCTALEITRQRPGLQIMEAGALLDAAISFGAAATPAWCETQGIGTYTPPHVPYPLIPTQPVLLWAGGDGRWIADQRVQTLLQQRYPAEHPVRLVQLDPHGNGEAISELPLEELATADQASTATALYLPPLAAAADRRSADGLGWVVARLLGPDGCPWDRDQTHQSLRAGLLEETHEVLEALDTGDRHALAEELGDLLLQVFVHSEMTRQAGHFALGDVFEQISTKLIRRHPHVFGDLTVDGTGAVLHNWEQIKAQELAEKGKQRSGTLDGIPVSLPALAAAQKLVTKAARVGFDWSAIQEVVAKVQEELDELIVECNHVQAGMAEAQPRVVEEFGDVLFALANLARWLDLDAESALRAANIKFRRRFAYVEQQAQSQGRSLDALPKSELYALWIGAKREEEQ